MVVSPRSTQSSGKPYSAQVSRRAASSVSAAYTVWARRKLSTDTVTVSSPDASGSRLSRSGGVSERQASARARWGTAVLFTYACALLWKKRVACSTPGACAT